MSRIPLLRGVLKLGVALVVQNLLIGTTYADFPVAQVPVQIPGATAPVSPAPPTLVAALPWRVLQYNSGGSGMDSVLPGTQITAMFGDDGNVNGDTGCNTYRGPYALSDSTIMFGALVSTRRACLPDAAAAQEQAFLAALGASTIYQLVGDRLTLRDAAGATQILMVRPTVEPPPAPDRASP